MRIRTNSTYATLVSGLTVFSLAQWGTTPTLVLNGAKPIVYIELDHIWPRPPVEDDEPDRGLWLRLVNNSVVPIEVEPMVASSDPELTLLPDEIEGRWIRIKESDVPEPKRPMSYVGGDMVSTELIQPGKGLLFSVPVTHVGRSWYMRVPFRFHLPPIKLATQPLSYAQYTLEDIPENLRSNRGCEPSLATCHSRIGNCSKVALISSKRMQSEETSLP